MRALTPREIIVGCFLAIIISLLMISSLLFKRSAPLITDDVFGDISVRFTAEQSQVRLPNDCTILAWQVDGAEQVYLDNLPVEPVGFSEFCPTSPQMPVLKVDYSVHLSREYRLPIEIVVYQMDFILLLGILVTLGGVGVGLMIGSKSALLQSIIGAWFVAWALDFIINRTTFRLFDGNRYFALFDDAMISMRYAWNFVNGNGLVWNVGERVEGYSNLLMVIAMMPANFLFSKGMAVFVMHLFGLCLLLMIAYLTAKIASLLFLTDQTIHQTLQKALFFGVALSYYPLTYWSLMGMETSLLTMMMLLAFWAMLNDKPYQMAIYAGLTYLTRQDGLLLVLPILIYWAHQQGYLKRVVGVTMLLFALFPLGQQIFRVLYYGEWLPNTYVMKVSGIPLAHRLSDGMEYVLMFLTSVVIVVIINGIGAIQRPDGRKLLIASILILLMVYQVYVGGDAWLYWRMFSPIMPLMLAWFVHELVRWGSAYTSPDYVRVFVPLLVVVVLIVGPNQRFMPEITRKVVPYDVNLAEPLLRSAVALNHLVTEDAQVGVVMAGILPYYTGLYAIDYLGKSDPVIAHSAPDLSGSVGWLGRTNVPGHMKYNLYYSLQQLQPDFTQRCSWGYQNLCPFAEEYYRRVYYYDHEIWLKRGSPHVRWELIDDRAREMAFAGAYQALVPLDIRFETGLMISGVAMPDTVYQGQAFTIGLLLSAEQPQPLYVIVYELVNQTGETVLKHEVTRLNYSYTTADLLFDPVMNSQQEIPLTYAQPAGQYQVFVSFYHPVTLAKINTVDAVGMQISDRILLGRFRIID